MLLHPNTMNIVWGLSGQVNTIPHLRFVRLTLFQISPLNESNVDTQSLLHEWPARCVTLLSLLLISLHVSQHYCQLVPSVCMLLPGGRVPGRRHIWHCIRFRRGGGEWWFSSGTCRVPFRDWCGCCMPCCMWRLSCRFPLLSARKSDEHWLWYCYREWNLKQS